MGDSSVVRSPAMPGSGSCASPASSVNTTSRPREAPMMRSGCGPPHGSARPPLARGWHPRLTVPMSSSTGRKLMPSTPWPLGYGPISQPAMAHSVGREVHVRERRGHLDGRAAQQRGPVDEQRARASRREPACVSSDGHPSAIPLSAVRMTIGSGRPWAANLDKDRGEHPVDGQQRFAVAYQRELGQRLPSRPKKGGLSARSSSAVGGRAPGGHVRAARVRHGRRGPGAQAGSARRGRACGPCPTCVA